MIKVSKHLYIHWLTIALFACAYITRTLGITAAVYSVMLLHELAHTAVAALLGLGINRIEMYPFGVSLKIRTRMLCSMPDAVALYMAGPCVNITSALICMAVWGKNIFYYNNLLLFALNMLPVLPLDGGQLAQYYLSAKIGEKRSNRLLKLAAVLLSTAIAAVVLYYGEIGINSAAFCGFLLASIFTQRPKYSRDFVRELSGAGYKRKYPLRAEVIVAKEETPKRRIAEAFNPARGSIVVMHDSKQILTDEEIIAGILNTR